MLTMRQPRHDSGAGDGLVLKRPMFSCRCHRSVGLTVFTATSLWVDVGLLPPSESKPPKYYIPCGSSENHDRVNCVSPLQGSSTLMDTVCGFFSSLVIISTPFG